MTLEWMAWTLPTAMFFIAIALLLTLMGVWQVLSPSIERRGFLPLSTTRGDRLFIGMLGSMFIALAWIGFTDWTLWLALAVCVAWMAVVMRWG